MNLCQKFNKPNSMKKLITYSIAVFFFVMITSENTFANMESANKYGKISGKVLDDLSDKPMIFVNIALINILDSTLVSECISDEDGSFEMIKVPEGKYNIIIEFVGYEKQIIPNIQINSTQKIIQLQDINLDSSLSNLDESALIGEEIV